MRWSFSLIRVFGIDIRVHMTFFLILIFGAAQWSQLGVPGMAFGALEILLIFLCVVLHELGHSAVAIHYGIPVREIVLLPIGGVAMIGRNPSRPIEELLIAIAGPLVNVVIGGILFLVLNFTPLRGHVDLHALVNGSAKPSAALMLALLLNVNIALVLFNLIPAFPLDGGRMLRALLAMRLPAAQATSIAAHIGQVAAVLLGIWGLVTGNVLLLFVAAFIFFGAGAENAQMRQRVTFTGRRIGETYNRHALILSDNDRVSRVVDYLLTSYQPDFAVVSRGKLDGVVSREDVLRWLSANSYDCYVTEIMHADVPRVDAGATLEQVREIMEQTQRRVVAVFAGSSFLGLVSAEDLAEAQVVLAFVENSGLRRRSAVPAGTPEPTASAANSGGASPADSLPVLPPDPQIHG